MVLPITNIFPKKKLPTLNFGIHWSEFNMEKEVDVPDNRAKHPSTTTHHTAIALKSFGLNL